MKILAKEISERGRISSVKKPSTNKTILGSREILMDQGAVCVGAVNIVSGRTVNIWVVC
jgi:hypothetical protein